MPSADLPLPITPQRWKFRQSVDYEVTANRAVIDAASRNREALLFGIYRMGKNSIDRGNRDSWTVSPRALAAGRGGFERQFRDPARRDARAYILPSDQPDFLTATKFIEALLKTGVTVHRATTTFKAGDKSYPAGSFVVKAAQAFRPHVLDMFEPQDHPDDIPYPGGPPTPPYDNAGWTLAFQMGVKFDRFLEALEGPFEPLDSVPRPEGRVIGSARATGYFLGHQQNDAFTAAGRLLAAGQDVLWPRDRSIGSAPGNLGAMYIPARPDTRAFLEKLGGDLGLTFTAAAAPPSGPAMKLRPVRIALWDRYGGSSSSGWTRWLLERYGFRFDVVYAQAIDAGELKGRYDVLILTDDTRLDAREGSNGASDRIPQEYRHTTGSLTTARSLPRLKQFVEEGGTVIAVGRSTSIAEDLGLPVSSALVDGKGDNARPLKPEQYYVPGSVLRVSVDNTTPLGYGFERQVDVFFDNSPVFRLGQSGDAVNRVAWFSSAAPLRSGWAWGQQYLENGVAVVDARLGRGRVLLFGPEVNYRAQSHGTFKFLFNAIYYATAEPVSGF